MVDEREPALDGVGAAPGDPRFPRAIQPFLYIGYQEEGRDNKVVQQNRRDTLVIVLRTRDLPLDERVIDLNSWWRAESSSVEDGYGTFYSARHALCEDKRGKAVYASGGRIIQPAEP